jgi:carbonic anhydrase
MVMDPTMKSKPASGAQEARVAPRGPQVDKKGGPMNAEQAMQRLMEGNGRYVAGELQPKDVKSKRAETLSGQKPYATVLTCSDSRVEPALIFDANLGEIFGIQTAGNVIDDIAWESIKYAIVHLKTPVVMVLGHTKCGAVTAVYDGVAQKELPTIAGKIEPSIKDIERTDDKDADVTSCVALNLKAVMAEIMERARKDEDVIKALKSGETILVGAINHIDDGHVEIAEQMKMAA